MPFSALIFDMDGTIVDNMRFHDAAWGEWHRRHGLPFDPDGFFATTAGRTNREILTDLFPGRDVAEIDALGEEKEAIYRELYRPRVAALAGLHALMSAADARGRPMSVATAAPPANQDVVLDALGIRARFRAVVAPSQGFRGKPHPDLFLAAAERMGVPAGACLVFEDAPLGIEAARRAGMKAVAITTMLSPEAFPDDDTVIARVADFTALDAAKLLG
jgi:HAD superfamily hydrolase (TIGR01509 family)